MIPLYQAGDFDNGQVQMLLTEAPEKKQADPDNIHLKKLNRLAGLNLDGVSFNFERTARPKPAATALWPESHEKEFVSGEPGDNQEMRGRQMAPEIGIEGAA
jgi:hypothetical protein